MDSECMQALIEEQYDLFESMKRLSTNYKKDSRARKTKTYFDNRIKAFNEYWVEFRDNHKTISRNKSKIGDEFKGYFSEDTYGTVEEYYLETKSQLEEDELQLCPSNIEKTTTSSEPQRVFERVIEKVVEKDDVHLPRINIPKFSGEYKEWASFRDLYTTLIHNNKTLSDVKRLHYLKSSLSGEAAQIIRHYTITEANYMPAWEALNNRFDNKRLLIKTQLSILFSQPSANIETASSLRKLLDTTEECVQSLKGLSIDTSNWDVILSFIVSERLPAGTRKLWEQHVGGEKEFPSYERLKTFLDGQCRALEALQTKVSRVSGQRHTFHATKTYSCILCDGPHSIRQCSKFLRLDHDGRRNVVIQKHLCSNCLAKGHIASSCPSRSSCYKCRHRHHTLLHDDNTITNKTTSSSNRLQGIDKSEPQGSDRDIPTTSSCHTAACNKNELSSGEVLLATALVRISSDKGLEMIARVLIDQGSQSTFITESLVQRLNLHCQPACAKILGLGNVETGRTKGTVSVCITSLERTHSIQIKALVLNKLTSILPQNRLQPQGYWEHLKGLELADPQWFQPGKIDMILGADAYSKIILNGLRIGEVGSPIAQRTIFGWILSGEIARKSPENEYRVTSVFHTCHDINEQLRKFWEIEEVNTETILSHEDRLCEEHYKSTVKRLPDGRYIVRLPFKNADSKPIFGRSRSSALSRFRQLETQFARSKELHETYSKCLQEYLDMKHMVPTSSDEIENMCQDKSGFVFYKTNYLPHHAVRKESTTTKLRVVFDASHKTIGGPSLNELLLTGPKIQDDLLWILLRWRKHEVVITADIEKMYRQIRLHDEDAEYQRILWRRSPDEVIRDYKLQTVTFGTSSAPYLAIRTLHQLANDYLNQYPIAAKVLKADFYVDDLLSGTDSVEDCLQLQSQLIELLNTGGFNLRKWASNRIELLQKIPLADREISGVREFSIGESVKTLGINWYPKTDLFRYKLSSTFSDSAKITKRKLLSDISKLFDPLGFLAPLLIKLKILMQYLWMKGTDWDQEVPSDIVAVWLKTVSELGVIERIEVPRWVRTKTNAIEIHGFCDGSLQAYAAVLYVRSKDEFGNITVTILTAKSRVAPIKQISLPRIELCGALLLTRLFTTVKRAMNFENVTLRAWTDSTIVLSWIRGHPTKYKTFVGNRIAEIQQNSDIENWGHVRTNENPADSASRGLYPKELLAAELWWNGPEWLKKSPKHWPTLPHLEENNTERKRETHTLYSTNSEPSNLDVLIEKYSSLTKLLRVTARCFRFIDRCNRRHQQTEPRPSLSTTEIEGALKFWVKKAQQKTFQEELSNLKAKKQIKGSLIKLNPFIDGEGILRVGGRLQNADIPWSERHPIILPHNSDLTSLIVDQAHRATLHGGVQLMVCTLRLKYWIINIRKVTKQHIHKCIICFRQRQEHRQQLMGNLPTPRVRRSRPFTHVGVDYCGPLEIKTSKVKTAKSQKGYLAIFICLVTRAIHIEVVSELTAQAFIAALKRFVGRRGLCSDLYSDNATNFVGARNILRDEFNRHLSVLHKEVSELVLRENINWHFIPPASPHFGGLWEAGVKSTKWHLKRILGNSKLTFEELTTTVIQIEACLNSRPLCPLTNDPEDISALTPGHFLIGSALIAVPEQSLLQQNAHRLTRWQHMQQLSQTFWKRWQGEYLTSLQQRPKWATKKKNVEVGNLVLIREDNLPPCKWLLARIVETCPGSDGLVRVVKLKTKDATLKRAITKICLLPIDETQDEGLRSNEITSH